MNTTVRTTIRKPLPSGHPPPARSFFRNFLQEFIFRRELQNPSDLSHLNDIIFNMFIYENFKHRIIQMTNYISQQSNNGPVQLPIILIISSMRSLQLLIFFLSILLSNTSTTVSLQHLRTFFNQTYDLDHDGSITRSQFLAYYQKMEPQHNLQEEDVKQTFQVFDSNNDQRIVLKQLVQIAKINVDLIKSGHRQIHLGLTSEQGEMQIMWVTTPDSYPKPVVYYGHFPSQLNNKTYAISSTYSVGHMGFHGSIYKAVLRNLQPKKRYYYKVGDDHYKKFSAIKYFSGPPKEGQQLSQINFAVFGDMGTFAPFGHMVMSQIVRDNLVKPFDFVFLTGDIAYAGMGSEKNGQTQPIWDLFGQLSESFAAYCPFMPGVGNHEKYYNYAAYLARYDLPKIYPTQTNLWFSFNYGQLHVAHFSSEHPYEKGSEQYNFLEQDLRLAHQNKDIKWIILGVHRAFYSSDKTEYAQITHLTAALQQLVNKYKVDIVQTGHLHSYERSWPTYKGKALKQGHQQNHFSSPKAPIYVVQGSAGALINEKWVTPKPQWSIKRMLKYGYGKVRIVGSILKYQYIDAANGKVLDEWIISKQMQQEKTKEM